MTKKIRPIIKWTGGKFDEFPAFADQIPTFERYIEPFFGGGGVYFALQPKVNALINDKSTDLYHFYQQLGHKSFETELLKYVIAWDEVGDLHKHLWNKCAKEFTAYLAQQIGYDVFTKKISEELFNALKNMVLLRNREFLVDLNGFEPKLLASITDKAKRIQRICVKEHRNFTQDEIKNHFETGIRSGFYLFFRNILNQEFTQSIALSAAKKAANWYFVREFCYASMFRFNAKGEFNIPYGGIAYNKKNLRQKVLHIFDESIAKLFKNTIMYNLDFENFLNKIELEPTDFIFLDPPYDSEFSEYDQNSFSRADQQRLAALLIPSVAKWMVVIKETDFIREIYTHPNIHIATFHKNYSYNVRGRNHRAVKHLIITNY